MIPNQCVYVLKTIAYSYEVHFELSKISLYYFIYIIIFTLNFMIYCISFSYKLRETI